ncbi:MAG TPA: 30S ribosomal protein S20 [bacterium]|nr:30S ribosomal protein S20 [bacterium]HPN44483.1 30S ribosomal protein S20 [bacterium]
MAHHKSALKRIQTNARDNEKNKAYLSALKTELKKVRTAKSKDEAVIQLKSAASQLDKLVKKGIIHKNKAANQKSRLAIVVNKLQ